MHLRVVDLLAAIPAHHDARLVGDGDVRLCGATLDSREVRDGWLFIARPGEHRDGHDFVPAAIEAGAQAVVVERELAISVPQIVVRDVAQAVGPIAAAIHGHPAQAMTMIGVTGTNGKTTTTTLIYDILTRLGYRAGLIGTVETRMGTQRIDGLRTTPEATDLQRLLAQMRDQGITTVVMEVSSHGIDLGRINGVHFAAVGFTNLSQDHLDYHHTMEAYGDVKARLFGPAFTDQAWVILGDPDHPDTRWSDYVTNRKNLELHTISQFRDAEVNITNVDLAAVSSTFTLAVTGQEWPVTVPMPGRFNVDNAALALMLVSAAGVDLAAAIGALAQGQGVAGRSQVVPGPADAPTVIVDYAHSPDAIHHVLTALRATATGKVVCLIGCGGDRDREKRPLMADAALAGADLVVFTSDNPRSEDPETILDAMTGHLEQSDAGNGLGQWVRIADRRAAIRHAIVNAQGGDTVVLAGKGHETYQEIHGVRHPFDDRAEARLVLETYYTPATGQEASGR